MGWIQLYGCFETGSHFVAQPGFRLSVILSQFFRGWNFKLESPCLAQFFNRFYSEINQILVLLFINQVSLGIWPCIIHKVLHPFYTVFKTTGSDNFLTVHYIRALLCKAIKADSCLLWHCSLWSPVKSRDWNLGHIMHVNTVEMLNPWGILKNEQKLQCEIKSPTTEDITYKDRLSKCRKF